MSETKINENGRIYAAAAFWRHLQLTAPDVEAKIPTRLATRALAAALEAYEEKRPRDEDEPYELDSDERDAFKRVLELAECQMGTESAISKEIGASHGKAIKLVREVLADAFPEPEKEPEPEKTNGQVLYETRGNPKPWSALLREDQLTYETGAQKLLDHSDAKRKQVQEELKAKALEGLKKNPTKVEMKDGKCTCAYCTLSNVSPYVPFTLR